MAFGTSLTCQHNRLSVTSIKETTLELLKKSQTVAPPDNHNYRGQIYADYLRLPAERTETQLSYNADEYRRWAAACQARITGWLPRDKTAVCLDAGCGPGKFLYLLRQEDYQNISGVDIGSQQAQSARQICPHVKQGDVQEHLNQFVSHFDCITAFDLIEHFRKEELFPRLAALYRALKPGGVLILQTPNAESPWGLTMRYGDFTHEVAFDAHSLEQVLRTADFQAFEARPCGPYASGWKGLARLVIWKGIWSSLALWNLAETGNIGSGIYTRVFMAKVEKPRD